MRNFWLIVGEYQSVLKVRLSERIHQIEDSFRAVTFLVWYSMKFSIATCNGDNPNQKHHHHS